MIVSMSDRDVVVLMQRFEIIHEIIPFSALLYYWLV